MVRLLALAGLCLLGSSCVGPSGTVPGGGPLNGLVFTRTITPLTGDLHGAPVVQDSGQGDVKQIDYSYVRVQWSANGLGEIAKTNGFSEIYYADLETMTVLGVWKQQWARVYGKRATP